METCSFLSLIAELTGAFPQYIQMHGVSNPRQSPMERNSSAYSCKPNNKVINARITMQTSSSSMYTACITSAGGEEEERGGGVTAYVLEDRQTNKSA